MLAPNSACLDTLMYPALNSYGKERNKTFKSVDNKNIEIRSNLM